MESPLLVNSLVILLLSGAKISATLRDASVPGFPFKEKCCNTQEQAHYLYIITKCKQNHIEYTLFIISQCARVDKTVYSYIDLSLVLLCVLDIFCIHILLCTMYNNLNTQMNKYLHLYVCTLYVHMYGSIEKSHSKALKFRQLDLIIYSIFCCRSTWCKKGIRNFVKQVQPNERDCVTRSVFFKAYYNN